VSSGPSVSVDGTAWEIAGAQLAIVDAENRVLLQLRPWPPGWELPGGHCDAGEEPAAAAAREAQEETGLSVRVTRLVGVYTWRGLRASSDAVFLGEVTGGAWRRSIEAVSSRYATAEDLPATTFPWIHQRVADAVAAAGGAAPVHRVQPVTMRHLLFFGASWAGTMVDGVRRWRHGRGRRSNQPGDAR
jgi:8-oxo-dGTP pyrophosphatase MutT (NUDIX family)